MTLDCLTTTHRDFLGDGKSFFESLDKFQLVTVRGQNRDSEEM